MLYGVLATSSKVTWIAAEVVSKYQLMVRVWIQYVCAQHSLIHWELVFSTRMGERKQTSTGCKRAQAAAASLAPAGLLQD